MNNFQIYKKQKQFLFFLFKISILIVFLRSLNAWFLWELSPFITGSISILFCTLFLSVNKSFYSLKIEKLISVFILLIVEFYCIRNSNLKGYIGAFLITMPIIFVLLLIDEIKVDLLRFITLFCSILLFISLFAWLLFIVGVKLPYSVVNFNNGQYWYNNYYFFLYDLNPLVVIPRFSSVFLEPGQLGIITIFLLFANHFNYRRREVWVLFIVTIFTFSLAAYILLIISVVIFIFIKTRKPIVYLTIWLILLTTGYIFFNSQNDGNNVINNLIISRLQIEYGNLAGNNRFSPEMDSYFDDFLKSDKFYTGVGIEDYEKLNLGANAGYKLFMVQYGLIGTLLLLIFYIVLVYKYSSKFSFFLFIVYLLSFLQASYALWECELLIFICSIPNTNSLQEINNKWEIRTK
jgi:hypothetical protein